MKALAAGSDPVLVCMPENADILQATHAAIAFAL